LRTQDPPVKRDLTIRAAASRSELPAQALRLAVLNQFGLLTPDTVKHWVMFSLRVVEFNDVSAKNGSALPSNKSATHFFHSHKI
jgi:hypothetical protein